MGIEPVGDSSQAFGALIASEIGKWSTVIADAKIRTDE